MTHSFRKLLFIIGALGSALSLSGCATAQEQDASAALELSVYNPGSNSIFPVSSTLVTGPTEAVLIDAQFQRNDAQALVKKIQQTGKTLTTIYISHGDPDYYFGLDVLTRAFPKAKVYATPSTVKKISASMQGKKAYWGPILKDNAPEFLVLPTVLNSDKILIDGQELRIVGTQGHDPAHTFVYIPSLATVTGGVVVFDNMHVWIADNQTPESRQKWLKTLQDIKALKPQRVIPGHFLGERPQTLDSVNFTRDYLNFVEATLPNSANSGELIKQVKAQYPALGDEGTLELSAKVLTGEMKWPAGE